MSLSIPTTCAPSFANRFTVSEPINPADPVTIIVRIYSPIIVKASLPGNPGDITLRNVATQLIQPIVDLAAAMMGEKVNIPGDVVSDVMCIEGDQTRGFHQGQIHI